MLAFQSEGKMSNKTIVLTSGSSWAVPADWNNEANTIEVIGGGGGGSGAQVGGANAQSGGGGGEYRKLANFEAIAGQTVSYSIGGGGAWASSDA
ncbi:hypothetical protein BGC_08150 [Burkholderia sp. 3C]